MADVSSTERTLLKILNGVQMGAEVALSAGDYTLGSGPADDLQIIDVSVKPGHARLRVATGQIAVRAGSGPVATSRGQSLTADSDVWSELEPLEIVTVGAVRFALGPPTAQWTTLTDAPAESSAPRKLPPSPMTAPAGRYMTTLMSLAFFVLGGLFVYFAVHGAGRDAATAATDPRAQLAAVRAILDSFPFGKPIKLRQEVDGELFATGYVETPAERRALMAAVAKAAAPVKLRLEVLESLRAQIDDLVRAEKARVSYRLDPDGALTLEGLILDDDQERKFVERLRGAVIGLAKVESNIVTARKLLAEIEKLGKSSRLDPYVLFRLDHQLVEASGALPTEKIDLWVGFLQTYSKRFAADIALRSLVRLQNPDGSAPEEPPPDRAVVVGPAPNALDVQRLAEGRYQLNDIFASKPSSAVARGPTVPVQPTTRPLEPARPSPAASPSPATGAPSTPAVTAATAFAPAPVSAAPISAAAPAEPSKTPAPLAAAISGQAAAAAPPTPTPAAVAPSAAMTPPSAPPALAAIAEPKPAPPPASAPVSAGACKAGAEAQAGACTAKTEPAEALRSAAAASTDLVQGAYDFLKIRAAEALRPAPVAARVETPGPAPEPASPSSPAPSPASTAVAAALAPGPARPSDADPRATPSPERWLPLLGDARRSRRADACAPGSYLTFANIVGALAWLDLLSVGQAPPLETMEVEQQGLILAAALNPSLASDCLQRAQRRFNGERVESLYLHEVETNPAFIHYIADGLAPYPLEVTGADVLARYLQVRDGRRLFEGTAPDGATRLAIVGELGAAVRGPNGYGIVIYAQKINWLVR